MEGSEMNRMRIRWLSKGVVILIVTITCGMLLACGANKKEESKETGESFDMKAATNVTDTYMKYLTKEDIENSKKFYSKDLLKNVVSEENKNLKIFGYNLTDTSEVGKSGIFKMKVSRADITKPFASLDEYSIKIVKEESDYKISETNNTVQKEAFIEGSQIRLRNKNNVNTNLIIDIGSIPNYTFSKDDKTNIDKIQVPKTKFSLINFSYGGENLAIATQDKDSYIAIVKIDESLAVQSDKGDDGKAGGGGSKESQGGGDKAKEKPIGKEITSVDLLKDSKVEFMAFSPEEKNLTVQYTKPGIIGHCLRVYKLEGGDLIPFKFEEKYPLDKVDITFSSYDKETLNFDVVPKKSGDKNVTDITGKWQLSLKDFKAKKM
jgi:hypothetical protein